MGEEARQKQLPLPWHLVRPYVEPDFAHPAERDFSQILTYYRIRWVYEPTTFALEWGVDGRPSEMFTPDFYLPDHRLYIELTTMRQRLVTRKNRKLRRLRELYPSVRVKLLYRRDYDRLVDSFPTFADQPRVCRVGRTLFSEEQIETRTGEIADRIAASRQFTTMDGESTGGVPPLVLGVGSGSVHFLQALGGALRDRELVFETDFVYLTRFHTAGGMRRVRIRRPPAVSLAGRRVLIVTDVISTGLSLAYLTRWLRRRGVQEVEICTLLDRAEARLLDLPVHYVGFEAPNEVLVGFGLPLRRQFRDLPYIAALVLE